MQGGLRIHMEAKDRGDQVKSFQLHSGSDWTIEDGP